MQGLQIAADAYIAYQHADCETVYRLTQPQQLDAMQATELRYALRLVRGFCQELDGDQPTARLSYRQVIREAPPGSFAAADADERLRALDRLADDPEFARRLEQTALRPPVLPTPREASERSEALYPPLARAAGVEGFAVVEFGIRRNGQTTDPVVVDSEPPFVFEGTALRAVRSWRYRSKRQADPDERHMIRIVFQTATPVTLEEQAAGEADPADAPPSEAPGPAPIPGSHPRDAREALPPPAPAP
ncbi:MAG: energy transducer TonB [Myxococcota bacterium]